jgi:multiple sugar transport system permease protein
MIIPIIWMLVTSFETLRETRHFPPTLIPSSIRWQNYTAVLQQAPFARWFLNTVIVTMVVVAGNLLFCSLAGYAFARIKFFGRDVVFILVLATLMIPFQVIIIPTFLIVRRLGLIYRRDKALSKAALGFIQIILDNMGEHRTADSKKLPKLVTG